MWTERHLYDKEAIGYDSYIREFVPAYDTMQERVVDLIEEVLGSRCQHVIELGVGTGALAFRLLSKLPIERYTGFESSPHMAAIAESRLAVFRADVKIDERDFRQRKWPAESDVIMSTLTFHYLSNDEKLSAFQKAFGSLRNGGMIVLGDRVLSKNPTINQVYYSRMERFWRKTTRHWCDDKQADHRTQDSPSEEPWYLDDQMAWLQDVGFAQVECAWKDFNYCVFCGVK
jgi:tRNA (cmo5U34)-methyltransferase